MNPLVWKKQAAMEGPHSPSPDYPGVTALPPASDEATKVIWQDPSSYNAYVHGPPYLPGMKVRRDRTAAMNTKEVLSRVGHTAGQELPALLTLLRALAMVHQTHHWLTAGKTYYADHLLFDRLYGDLAGEIDSVGERAVGLGAPSDTMHPSIQAHQMAEIIEALCGDGVTFGEGEGSESYVATSLKAERWFLGCVKQVAEEMKASGSLSRGTDNLLAGIEDKHEEHIYLLSQRGKTASADPWKATV